MRKFLIGSFILLNLLAPLLLVNLAVAGTNDCPANGAPANTAVCNPAGGLFIDLPNNTFEGIFLFVIQSLLGIVGILSVLFIIIGGYQYVTSAGSEEQAEAGKKTLTNAIIGLVIVILAYTIVIVLINGVQGKV